MYCVNFCIVHIFCVKNCPPWHPYFVPPRIFDTQSASPGMPLDAPACTSCVGTMYYYVLADVLCFFSIYMEDAPRDIATLTSHLGDDHDGASRRYGSSYSVCVPSLKFVGLFIRKT